MARRVTRAEADLPATALRVVLASGSPSRLALLRAAGVEPDVVVSDVDEEAVAAALGAEAAPGDVVAALARAKAEAVAERLLAGPGPAPDTVIVAADSAFLLHGELHGKPHTPEVAWARWQKMSGQTGTLLTGHCLLRLTDGRIAARAYEVGRADIRFGDLSGDEARAYLATGEPLEVAGAFTLEGRGSWFIERIEGDPSTVIGLGLPVLRALLAQVGLDVAALWQASGSPTGAA
ncbi:septum formation protein Maf [Segniliparus rugosus ATCC BAA-974]|uniref:Nucleoside triphosphate pyrophosphatase n=1 Tax=Segniliparus rugosus (strain ATCC BAA-974 / DSM 45345 / CCUG 50838 / CIP 108380 / JCM 13579 / CDC 945) TaxID=679197 RepID=E5XR39_SEGRC|nr:septum formation protein Maf [Segniliparus rugosus ATCC BAA-974]